MVPLSEDLDTEVCILGAGLAGLTTAYLLSQEGIPCVILERGSVGSSGQTLRTTAHVTNVMDEGFVKLEAVHGRASAQKVAESHKEAVQLISRIAGELDEDCSLRWVDGYLFRGRASSAEDLEKEFFASRRAGLAECFKVEKAPWPSYDTGPCICYPGQLTLNPAPYLRGICQKLQERGVRIFSHSPALKVNADPSPLIHTPLGKRVRARHLVVATNSPIYSQVWVHTKQAAYRTYVVGGWVPKDSFPDGLFWDVESPYHYVRKILGDGDKDLLIIGGEDHKTGEEKGGSSEFEKLKAWARRRFPELQTFEFEWSGQVMEPADGLGMMGQHKDDTTYIITGDSGQGFTHGSLGACIVSDRIAGRKNPWEDLYDPGRFEIQATGTLFKENAKVLGHYAEWLKKEKPEYIRNLQPGEGVILQKGFKKVAVCKDQDSTVHTRSAACTHLGCVVHWNRTEKTWDCPCHGSRFSPQGEVLQGPALKPLAGAPSEEPSPL